MPILKHAIKKLRQDKRRTDANKRVRTQLKSAIKTLRTKPEDKLLAVAFSAIDRAAKKRVIHPGRADRLKRRLSKLSAKSTPTAK